MLEFFVFSHGSLSLCAPVDSTSACARSAKQLQGTQIDAQSDIRGSPMFCFSVSIFWNLI